MQKFSWFDNETGTHFSVGDKVIWHGDDEQTGVLVEIKESSFSVKWDDGVLVEYDDSYQDAIKKH